jgi:hypothetical protein
MNWIENCECQIKEWMEDGCWTGDGGFVECCGVDIDIDKKWRDAENCSSREEGRGGAIYSCMYYDQNVIKN